MERRFARAPLGIVVFFSCDKVSSPNLEITQESAFKKLGLVAKLADVPTESKHFALNVPSLLTLFASKTRVSFNVSCISVRQLVQIFYINLQICDVNFLIAKYSISVWVLWLLKWEKMLSRHFALAQFGLIRFNPANLARLQGTFVSCMYFMFPCFSCTFHLWSDLNFVSFFLDIKYFNVSVRRPKFGE